MGREWVEVQGDEEVGGGPTAPRGWRGEDHRSESGATREGDGGGKITARRAVPPKRGRLLVNGGSAWPTLPGR